MLALPGRPPAWAAALVLSFTAAFSHSAPLTITNSEVPFQVTTLTEGLQHPWGMAFLPDQRILVTERTGTMRIVDAEGKPGEPLKGLPEIFVRGQGGLLDVTLAPDFAESKRIYFSYSQPDAKGKTNSTAVAHAILGEDELTEVTPIFVQQPKVNSNAHFGSRLVFHPDGTLFITLGDRYSRMTDAQTLDNHHGKVVRIKADGSAPADNPYLTTNGALPEIWSLGHRNVQGAALHPVTGQLWTGEHGPQGGDEINIDEAGKNYGWPIITYGENYGGGKIGIGTHKEGMEQPIHKWVPSLATAGMTFYTGKAFPQWKNNLFIASLASQTLVRLEIEDNKVVKEERLLKDDLKQRLRHVTQGPDGLLYLLTDESKGRILRIEPVAEES